MQYTTVQCTRLQCIALKFSAIQYNKIQHSAVQNSVIHSCRAAAAVDRAGKAWSPGSAGWGGEYVMFCNGLLCFNDVLYFTARL